MPFLGFFKKQEKVPEDEIQEKDSNFAEERPFLQDMPTDPEKLIFVANDIVCWVVSE